MKIYQIYSVRINNSVTLEGRKTNYLKEKTAKEKMLSLVIEYLNSVLFTADDNDVTDEIISAVTNHTPFENDWYGGIVSVSVVTAFQDRIDVEISNNEGEHLEIFVFQELDVIEE